MLQLEIRMMFDLKRVLFMVVVLLPVVLIVPLIIFY